MKNRINIDNPKVPGMPTNGFQNQGNSNDRFSQAELRSDSSIPTTDLSVKEFLNNKLPRKHCSQDLLVSIRQKIKTDQ